MEAIARVIETTHTSIIIGIKQTGAELPDVCEPDQLPQVGELDELETSGRLQEKPGLDLDRSGSFSAGHLGWGSGRPQCSNL